MNSARPCNTGDLMDGVVAEVVSRERVLGALRHLTDDLAPDDAGVCQFLGQLDALYGEITDEAAEAVRRVLSEAGARALLVELAALPEEAPEAQADPPETAADDLNTRQADPRGYEAATRFPHASLGHSGERLASPKERPPDETRGCTRCGTSFAVNVRHRRSHRFCSSSCRWRAAHYRRTEAHASSEGTSGGKRAGATHA